MEANGGEEEAAAAVAVALVAPQVFLMLAFRVGGGGWKWVMTDVVGDGMYTEDVLIPLAFVGGFFVWVTVMALVDLLSHDVELECWEDGWRGKDRNEKK